MTSTASTEHRGRWLVLVFAAVLAAAVSMVLGLTTVGAASAVTASPASDSSTTFVPALQTCVGVSASGLVLIVGAHNTTGAGQRRGEAVPGPGLVSGCCVAAEDAAGATRTVAIGRNMSGRVIPYAEKHGYDYYRGTPSWVPRSLERVAPNTMKKVDLWFNKRWISTEVGSGSRVMDIGEPPGMPPSDFYNMELNQVNGYWNYFQDPQP